MSNEEELKKRFLGNKESFVDLLQSQEKEVKANETSFVEMIENQEDAQDSDQNFIKKDNHFENVTQSKEVQEVIDRLKNAIIPKNNKKRDLDLEVGGLEAQETKEEMKDDFWDERSEEINDMAADVFNSTSMKSLVWKKKKERLDIKKDLAKDSLSMSEKEIAKKLAKLKNNPGPGRSR